MKSNLYNPFLGWLRDVVVTILLTTSSFQLQAHASTPERWSDAQGINEKTVGLVTTGLLCIGLVVVVRLLSHRDD